MADEKKIVVETQDLTKIYGDGDGVRALDGVNLTIHAGEFVAVMGPSGSGKSTLLNILGALDRPTQGVCKVNGQDLRQVKDLDRFRSKAVGFVFQLHNLIPTLTSLENVDNGYLQDLREFKESALGHAILDDHVPDELNGLGINQIAGQVREVLRKV